MARTEKAKKVVQRIRDKNTPRKAVYTFRLRSELISKFRATCDKEKVSTADVLEELISEFVGEQT